MDLFYVPILLLLYIVKKKKVIYFIGQHLQYVIYKNKSVGAYTKTKSDNVIGIA